MANACIRFSVPPPLPGLSPSHPRFLPPLDWQTSRASLFLFFLVAILILSLLLLIQGLCAFDAAGAEEYHPIQIVGLTSSDPSTFSIVYDGYASKWGLVASYHHISINRRPANPVTHALAKRDAASDKKAAAAQKAIDDIVCCFSPPPLSTS